MFAALPPGTPGNWSLFDADGNIAVPFDTFFSCTPKADSKVASSTVEKRDGQSGFVVYNKALAPTAVGVILAQTGKSDVLKAMLDALIKLHEGTDLVSIVTPERTFIDYTLVGFDYDRKGDNGVDRLLVSLSLQEVRQITPEYTNEQVKKAGDGSDKSAGKQQANTADDATKNRASQKSRAKAVADWLGGN
ncbi:MAG: hypothetical protein PHI96_00775 [Desulfovibrio sp.]|nr:hypothetical protein [Desulfovibrio sp.]